jgi:molybdenum cofactor biosynthesis enzyme MoaA
MVNPPKFNSWQDMQSSKWLADISEKFNSDIWPNECVRCQDTEAIKQSSIRLDAIKRHSILTKQDSDYIILSGVGDNTCNSACQSCNSNLSTKIGSLHGKNYIKVDNYSIIHRVPLDRVVEIDINGGEPTASTNYQELIDNLPSSVKVLRVNTNGSRVLKNLDNLLGRGIQVIVTLSLDGTGLVHDYVRWPIKWDQYQQTVHEYRSFTKKYSNLKLEAWTTLHTLNAANFADILAYCDNIGIGHSWAYLQQPSELNVKYSNRMSAAARDKLLNHHDIRCQEAAKVIATLSDNQLEFDQFVQTQDKLRKIHIGDYI